MGPDEASYQGKKRNEKSWARYREAMAKKAAPKPADSWRIETGPSTRVSKPTTKEFEFGNPKPSSYHVPKVTKSPSGAVTVDAGPNAGPIQQKAAAQLARWATEKKAKRTPKIKVQAPDPERPPYVYKQDNKVEFKPINVGENAVKHEKFYGKNPAPLLPKVKPPSAPQVTAPKEKHGIGGLVKGLVVAATAAIGATALTRAKSPAVTAEVKAAKAAVGTKPKTQTITLDKPIAEGYHYGMAADSLENRNAARKEAKGTEIKAALDYWNSSAGQKAHDLQTRHDNRRAAEGTKLRNAFEAIERADARAKTASSTQVSLPDVPAVPKPAVNVTQVVAQDIAQVKAPKATTVVKSKKTKVTKPKTTAEKFGATEADIQKVATSGETTAPPTAAQTQANAAKLSTAPKDVQDLAKQLEAARAENIALGGSVARVKAPEITPLSTPKATGPKVVTSPTVPTPSADKRLGERRGDVGTRRVNETRFTAAQASEVGVETPANKITSRRAKGSERRGKTPTPTLEEVANMPSAQREAIINAGQARLAEINAALGETEIPQVTAPEQQAPRVRRGGRRAATKKYWEEKNRRTDMLRNGLDPDTGGVLPSTGRDVVPHGKTTWVGPKTPKNIALSSVEATPSAVDQAAENIGKLRGKQALKAAQKEAKTTKTTSVGQTGVPILKAPETRSLAERSGMTADQIAAVTTKLEPKIDPITSGNTPTVERGARHVEQQATISETATELQKKVAALDKQIAKQEAEEAKIQKTFARGEKTAEAFQPGGATIEEQLRAPENADVKRIVRVGMAGGEKWSDKPAEFAVEQVIGKELEDLKARARGDRRQETRRSGLAGEIEAEIDKSKDLRERERRGGPRRVADVIDPADAFLLQQGEKDLVQSTREIERDITLEPEVAERITQKNSLDELRRVAEEARLEAAKTGNEGPEKLKTRAELEAELTARRTAPWFKGDIAAPRPGTGIGMFKLPTVAEEMEAAKVSNRLRARLQGAIQGMPVERRAPERKVTVPKEIPERRVEARGPQRPPGQAKVPQLSAPDMGQQLQAPEGRPGSQYVEKLPLERRRPGQFDIWPPEGTTSEESTRRVMENYARARAKAQPPLTSPGIGGSTEKAPAKPYKGPGGITVRGVAKGGAIGTALFAALGAAEAGSRELGKGTVEAAKAAGTTFFKEIPSVAKGLAAFTGIDLMATKVAPAVVAGAAKGFGASAVKATLLRGATAALGKAGVAGLIGRYSIPYAVEQSKELATQIGEGHLARTEAALEKKGSESKYGTVEAATATRKRKEAYKAALKKNRK